MYSRLGSVSIGDGHRHSAAMTRRHDPWYLVNKTVVPLRVYLERYGKGLEFIGEIDISDTKVVPPHTISKDDVLHFCTTRPSGSESLSSRASRSSEYRYLEPYTIEHLSNKFILIGGVVASGLAGHSQPAATGADLPGVHIRNLTASPLNIFLNDRLVAQVSGYDGRTLTGGSESVYYLHNDRFGLRLGDKLGIGRSTAGVPEVPEITTFIDDQYTSIIEVGRTVASDVVNPEDYPFDDPTRFPDQSIYRFGEGGYTGIVQYPSIAGEYFTRPTHSS